MTIDKSTVFRISQLARIDVPETELDDLASELTNILDWVEQLNAVNTDTVEPMTSVVPGLKLRLRKDIAFDANARDGVLSNAPVTRDGFFSVPKVIE